MVAGLGVVGHKAKQHNDDTFSATKTVKNGSSNGRRANILATTRVGQ